MVKFDCHVLGGTAEVKIIEGNPISLPGPGATPFGPTGPIAIIANRVPRIDCTNKMECGLTDSNTGITDWDGCPASVEYEKKGSLEDLPGVD